MSGADRATVFYVMQRESLAVLIVYLDALKNHQLIELDDAQRLQGEVAKLGGSSATLLHRA